MPALNAEQENILTETAETGQPIGAWPVLKQIIALRLREVVGEYYEQCKDCDNAERQTEFLEWRDRILALLGSFQRPPFTLQRLCELLLNPQRVYRSTRKLMSALEKLLMVTTTIRLAPAAGEAQSQARAQRETSITTACNHESGASNSMVSRGVASEDEGAPSRRQVSEGEVVPMDVDN